MANQQEKSNGLSNLKTIHRIQVGGELQEMLRDLRSTKHQMEDLIKVTSRLFTQKNNEENIENKVSKNDEVVQKLDLPEVKPVEDAKNINTNSNEKKYK